MGAGLSPHLGDFMPEVDRSFKRDLKSLDPRLGTKFNGEHFVVTYDRGYGEPVNIYRVKGDDGGFKQPDKRDLAVIKGGDMAEGEKPEIRLKKMAYASELMRREARKKAHESFRDATKDDAHYMGQKFRQLMGDGKANSAFRRIDPKPGKNTVKVIP
jgi:hypothetical protein